MSDVITVNERFNGLSAQSGDSQSRSVEYIVSGTGDHAAALGALEDDAPATLDGLRRTSVAVRQIADTDWEGTVTYSTKQSTADPPETGYDEISFDTTGGTSHIVRSLDTVDSNSALAAPPDLGGLIGVTENGVEGVDIVIPQAQFTARRIMADADCDSSYRATIYSLTGSVNAAEFMGHAAGTVLFMGASGQKRASGDWDVSFQFAWRPNSTESVYMYDPTNGDEIGANLAKGGWDYIWAQTAPFVDAAAKCVIEKPVSYFVEKVYPDGDFTLLALE